MGTLEKLEDYLHHREPRRLLRVAPRPRHFKAISNDLIRRLYNTMEEMEPKVKWSVLDQYGQKLLDSGYGLEQVRKTLVAGMKGFESREIRY